MTGYFSPHAVPTGPQTDPTRGFRAAARRRSLGRILRFGPPLVSLSALIWAAPALAQTTVSSSTTTPLVTSKAGDITIAPGGVIAPPSGVAVTIDSNNNVTNSGLIKFRNLDNVTGIQALGGHAGTISNGATIQVDDDSQPTTDSNGIPHGPFAKGTNRNGISVTGPGDFNGSIFNQTTGTISVKGDNSNGIFVGTNLTGTLSTAGGLNVTGNNSYGIRTTGNVSGDVTLSGTINGSGQGVQGVNLGGDVGGKVLIDGTLTTTGYRFTSRSTDPNFAKKLAQDDLLQGGATVTIGGSVAKGVLLNGAVTDPTTGAVTGATGTISSIASAPALVVGGAGNIVLGNVGTGTDAFGLELKGTAIGNGVYDNMAANAVQLGIAGGGTVDTTGGVRVSGAVGATAFAADATALHLNSGVIAPLLRNDGQISAALGSDAQGVTARAIVIEAGANTPALQNASSITASVAGQKADAAAIIDRSGTLREIENIGTIRATRTLTDVTQPVSGHDVAMDLSVNTTGVHLLQDTPAGATAVPAITGSVSLGSGADRVEILAGTLTGDLNLGAGANTLDIENGSTVKGALTATGGTVGLTVGTGTLQVDNASQLKLTSLSLGAKSVTILTADPAAGLATKLDVAGNATIASGATIGLRLASVQQGAATYTLIRADHLDAGTIDSTLLGAVPFLYTSSLKTDALAGTVSATLALKTADQLALPATTSGAYQALIANIGKDKGLEGALLAQSGRPGLINLYNQLLPNHSGSLFNLVAASVTAFGRPIDDRQDPVGGGFWMQETNTGVFADGKADNPGYKGWSLGAVAGYEIPRTPLGILGVTFGASTNQVYPDNVDSAENLHATLLDAGLYWRMSSGGLSANARIAADYVRVTSDRVIEVLGGDGLAVSRTANGRWSAYAINARGQVSYEKHFGNMYVRPLASVDYVRFAEGGYTETGGGPAMDVAVGSRTSSRFSALGGVAVGALYGPDHSWGPEALLGYKAVASEVLGVTTARFVGGGDAFTLRSDDISGSGAVAHLSLKGENGSGGFAIETGAEARDGLNIYDLRLTGHIQF
jgi:hypothetical protein